MAAHPTADRALLSVAALLFVGSAAITIAWCASMTDMPEMEMPGGWTMSMSWMRMPGQTWLAATASFLGMWSVMMVAMMLPAITPALRDYRRRHVGGPRVDLLTARVAVAYCGVWTVAGIAIYLLGLAFAELAMRVSAVSMAVPVLGAAALMGAGILQLTAWKERQLDCCRSLGRLRLDSGADYPWRYGLRLGLRCFTCCAPLTGALLTVGVMDLVAMAAATAAITLERLASFGVRVARLSGVLLIGAASVLLARAPV
jgi:predicted metal-binding membrane protein